MNRRKEETKKNKKNVQVAIRIRPINEMEKGEKGKAVAHCDRVTKTITMNAAKEQKLFGPFDAVYGAEASQTDIYMDIVNPLIQEVLSGYNCTVFAYGQTGTGKTFTMEGRHDRSNEYSWEDDPTAGIIPRALHHIFSELTALALDDYCVRVSYVELYNEELYDLLATGKIEDQPRLQIFDDKTHNGNGVLIKNLTQIAVVGRDEVYNLLKRGAKRRQTASTLMNKTSSRSHSIFTVSVLFPDRSASKYDERLLKTGKLHLVDLAGSESISRSGAVAVRAREAGNINQSLLTLGRVINALTTNSKHIPYRESKLTRILQDSLGGKTITTIIATLSPSSTNFEESISTLDYAQRAKNIKNNPEINQQVTRKSLLKEEIEKVRNDSAVALVVLKEEKEQMEKRQKEDADTILILQNEKKTYELKIAQMKNEYDLKIKEIIEKDALQRAEDKLHEYKLLVAGKDESIEKSKNEMDAKILEYEKLLDKTSADHKEQINALEKSQKEAFEFQLAQMKKEYDLKIKKLSNDLNKANEKQKKCEVEIAKMKQMINELQNENKQMKEKVQALEVKNDQMNNQPNAADNYEQLDIDSGDFNYVDGNKVPVIPTVESVPSGEESDSKENEMPIPMQASPGSTLTQSNIVRAPNYRLGHEYWGGIWVNHLYIFDSDDRTFCYNYTLIHENYFVCNNCKYIKNNVSARIASDENGEEYIKLGENKHVCQKRKYELQTVIYEPDYKLKTEPRGQRQRQLLYVFDSNDKTLYYTYKLVGDSYKCTSCKTTITAQLAKNNGKECCVLSAKKHECKPQKCISAL